MKKHQTVISAPWIEADKLKALGELPLGSSPPSAQDASFFARHVLFPLDQKPLTIVEVEMPDSLAARFFQFTTDGKTTVAVELSLLPELNATTRVQPLQFVLLAEP